MAMLPTLRFWSRGVSLNYGGLLCLCLVMSFALAPFAPTAFGQISTASINGTVRDATGSVIPEATLILTNVDTAVKKHTVSNAVVAYVFLNVAPGQYTLEAS